MFLIGSALSGIASSMGMLIAFRALQGVGGGGLSSLVQAITGDLIPARRRAKYQAYLGITATLGIVAGPLLGGVIADNLSWRWIFYINVPVGMAALVMIALKLHTPVRRSDRNVDYAGAALVTAFTTAVLLVSVWGGQKYGWTSATILALIAVSAVSLAAYILVERRAAEPIAAAAVSGTQISRTGHYKAYPVVGAVLSGVGMFVLSTIHASIPTWLIAIILILVGVGLGFFIQVALLAGQNAVEGRYLGVATGALNFFKSIGGAFGAAIFGAILAAQLNAAHTVVTITSGYTTVFFWCVPVSAIALILALGLREKPLSEEMAAVAAGEIDVLEY